jgi:prepilin-type N-terminal cleavage/methylation domain-containing protein
MKSIKKAKIKSLCKRYAKSKSGTTLVELVCVVTILGIISSAGIGGMFGMVKVARAGQNVSVAERSCALLTDQLAIYGNTSKNVKSVTDFGEDMPAYNDVTTPNGYCDGTSNTDENFVDYFISASTEEGQENTILLQKFDATDLTHPTTVSMIENIEYVTFYVTSFDLPTIGGTTTTKYALNYDIQTIYNYSISGAVVLNNVDDSTNVNFNSVTINTFGTDDYDSSNRTALNICSTNRELVDRT